MRIYKCSTCGETLSGQRLRCYRCNGRRRTGSELPCGTCGKLIYVAAWQQRSGEGKYCSRECGYAALRGQPSPQALPVGSRRLRSDGYVEIKVDAGEADDRYWPLEHRVVAARMLGRPLTTDEHVHHINKDKADNRPENLRVMTNSEHQHLHDHMQSWRGKRPNVTCTGCGKAFAKKPSRVTQNNFCSNTCRLDSGVAVDAMLAARGFGDNRNDQMESLGA